MPRLPADTARQRLRVGLARLHDTLDAGVDAACLQPRPDLRRLLALHAAALPPLVAGLEAAGAAALWPGWDEPARLASLAADLRAPGLTHPGAAVPFRPGAEVWGGIYALLGSRLGTRMLLRRFNGAGLPAENAFLRFGEADRTGWPRFVEALEAAAVTAGLDGMIEGGRRVMQFYLDRLPPGQDTPVAGHRTHDAAAPA